DLHVHDKLCKTVAPVLFGRRRGTTQRDHVVGNIRIARPDLAAVNAPASVNFCCLGFGGKQVRARAWFAHTDDEAQFASADARQNVRLKGRGGVFEKNGSSVAVRKKRRPRGGMGDTNFFGHHVTLKEAALVPAILFWPGHTDPTLGADTFAKSAVVRIA